MICEKTGCSAFIHQYGEWVYGDAHVTHSGDLIIRASAISFNGPINMSNRHYDVFTIEQWWDKNSQYSTLVVGRNFVFHGPEGKPERNCK